MIHARSRRILEISDRVAPARAGLAAVVVGYRSPPAFELRAHVNLLLWGSRKAEYWVRAEPVSTGRIASPNWMRGAAGWWAGRWPPTCGAAFAATPRRAWRSSSSSRAATIGAAPFSTGLPVAARLRGRPGEGGSMSTPESAIHGARRRQWAPIRVLGADRHPTFTPSPAPPPPFAAACFSRRRGRLTANGLHLSLPLELSKGLGPPQSARAVDDGG